MKRFFFDKKILLFKHKRYSRIYLWVYLCLYLSLPALPAFYTLYLRSPDLPLHTYAGLYPPLPAFTCLYLALTVFTFTAGARARVQYSVSALPCKYVALSSLPFRPVGKLATTGGVMLLPSQAMRVTVSAMVSCVHCTEHLIQQLQTLQPLRQQAEGKLIYDVRRQEYAASNQAVMVIVCALCPLAA